jgi:hypothetical protein
LHRMEEARFSATRIRQGSHWASRVRVDNPTMIRKVVAWNMQHQKGPVNWERLIDWPPISGAALYLLCEAVPAPRVGGNLLVRMHGSTKETNCPCPGDRCDNRVYSTAVASPKRLELITDFQPSRPGTWIACRSYFGKTPVTAIALYGVRDSHFSSYWESTRLSVSEIAPILRHEEYGMDVLLAGDFNILASAPRYPGHEVLESLTDEFDMADCLKAKLREDRYSDAIWRKDMDACQCGRLADCTHTRTFLRLSDPDTPHQDDYLYASRHLAEQLKSCTALPLDVVSPSDHAPIVAEFEL